MESTNRPYVVCHMLMALDGKIDGACISSACARAYGQLRTTLDCQATVYGTKTMLGSYSDGLAPAKLPSSETIWPREDYAAQSDVRSFIVSADPQGILGWNGKYVDKRGRPKAHVIEALTEQASNEYLNYLRKRDISYVFAGKERLDCAVLLSKLKLLFQIDRLMLAGGGQMNWSFAQEGLIDELSIVLAPTADGVRSSASLFERAAFLPEHPPAAFRLLLGSDAVRFAEDVLRRKQVVEQGCARLRSLMEQGGVSLSLASRGPCSPGNMWKNPWQKRTTASSAPGKCTISSPPATRERTDSGAAAGWGGRFPFSSLASTLGFILMN